MRVHRRVRQDARRGPRRDPRGDGAADDLHRQGWHHHGAQQQSRGAGGGEPPFGPLRRPQDGAGEHRPSDHHSVPFRPHLHREGRAAVRAGPRHRRPRPRHPRRARRRDWRRRVNRSRRSGEEPGSGAPGQVPQALRRVLPRDVLPQARAILREAPRGPVRAVQAGDARPREEGRRSRRANHRATAGGHHARQRIAREDDPAEARHRGARPGGAPTVRGVHDRRREVGRRGNGRADAGATGGAHARGDADQAEARHRRHRVEASPR
mmetsp:Transcript_5151/g.21025  ORF Transcript_5151/g.21025 Transcript_5151/m.21025 type:complete len:266 (+) Transcript_5151:791-1588(+)